MAKEVERSVGPTSEPLTAEDVRQHTRIRQTEEDPLFEKYITSAREQIEAMYDRTFFTTTWKAYWDRFETPLILPRPPYQSPLTSLTYVDEDGNTQTLTENTDFVVDSKSLHAMLKPAEGLSWPSAVEGDGYNAVIATYVGGYSTVATIPASMVQAVRLAVELLAERYGAYDERQLHEVPFNNIDSLMYATGAPVLA